MAGFLFIQMFLTASRFTNIKLLTFIVFFNKKNFYHIFCCNMFAFACPIIAKSPCWLFRANTGQISVFVLIYPYFPPNSTSGICAVVSKIICQSTRKWCIMICITSLFNQINTFQHIGIKFK